MPGAVPPGGFLPPPGPVPAGTPDPPSPLRQLAGLWKFGLAGGAVLVVVLLISVLVVDSRVSSADTADLEAGQAAFTRADCAQVETTAERITNRWRPPWIDGPLLTDPQQGCAELNRALSGSPSSQAVALAELRDTTAFPPIETAAGDELRTLMTSPQLADGAEDPLCAEIERLEGDGLVTADDHPFAVYRRCGLVRSNAGDLEVAVHLFDLAVGVASDTEVTHLADPQITSALVKSPAACPALDNLAPVLGAGASTKYATCGDDALASNDLQQAVDFYLDLVRLYPQSDEALYLGARVAGQPNLCPASSAANSLPFATDPTWVATHKLTCARTSLAARQWTASEGYLQEAVAQGAGTPPAVEAAALLDSIRPASGTILGQTIKLSGRISLAVVNNTADDLVVAALREDGQSVRFYVRSNETGKVRSFPVGNYQLLVLSGTQWLPDEATFVAVTDVSKVSEIFDVPSGYVGETTLTLGGTIEANVTPVPAACADLMAAGLPPVRDCTGPA